MNQPGALRENADAGRWIPAALAVFSLVVLLPGSGSPSQLTKGDVYTFVFMAAAGMLETGQYLIPLWNAKIDLSKPPLFHWALAEALRFFENPFFACRILPILCSWVSVLLIYALGRLLALSRERSLLASLIFLSCAAMADYGRQPLLEAPLLACLLAAFYGLTRACLAEKPLWLLLFGAGLGLSAMVKWVVGPATLAVYAAAYLAWSGRWRWLAGRPGHMAGALALAAAIALPWPILLVWRHFQEVRIHMYAQLYAERFGDYTPIGNFLGYVVTGFIPWSLLWIPALMRIKRASLEQKMALGSWLAGVFLPILLIANRSSRYAFPALPALALGLAATLAPLERPWRWSLRATAVLVGTCFATLVAALYWMGLSPAYLAALGLLASLGAAAALWRTEIGFIAVGAAACAACWAILVGPGVRAVGFHDIPPRVLEAIGGRDVRRFENLQEAASTGYLPIYLRRRVFIVDAGDLWCCGLQGNSMLVVLSGSSLDRLKAAALDQKISWRVLESWQSPHTHPRWEQVRKALETRSLAPLDVTHYLIELNR
ncbi:MAG: glycosyltransferase family 39 protein [Elusimicrobia bacterium]|nr:glycosyltransferase family 39 protein [Elusimicrobiota bacterium]